MNQRFFFFCEPHLATLALTRDLHLPSHRIDDGTISLFQSRNTAPPENIEETGVEEKGREEVVTSDRHRTMQEDRTERYRTDAEP